jgi:hypothetical protein
VIQAKLETPVAQQPETAAGKDPDRVARLETIVLVLSDPIESP